VTEGSEDPGEIMTQDRGQGTAAGTGRGPGRGQLTPVR
jgi:hypothetical protein